MNYKNYPFGLKKPGPSPVPGSKGAAESSLAPDETDHSSTAAWVGAIEPYRCKYCGRWVTSAGRGAKCDICGEAFCRRCLLDHDRCEECQGAARDKGKLGSFEHAMLCPACYESNADLCTCGNPLDPERQGYDLSSKHFCEYLKVKHAPGRGKQR